MFDLVHVWVIRQLTLGEFSSRQAVLWKAAAMAAKIAVFAYGLNVIGHFILVALGLLPYPLAAPCRSPYLPVSRKGWPNWASVSCFPAQIARFTSPRRPVAIESCMRERLRKRPSGLPFLTMISCRPIAHGSQPEHRLGAK